MFGSEKIVEFERRIETDSRHADSQDADDVAETGAAEHREPR
jgi:hypothetical protein